MGISTILLIITLISFFSLFKGIQNKKKTIIWSSLIVLFMIIALLFTIVFLTPDYI
jgi:hypothetical protein